MLRMDGRHPEHLAVNLPKHVWIPAFVGMALRV